MRSGDPQGKGSAWQRDCHTGRGVGEGLSRGPVVLPVDVQPPFLLILPAPRLGCLPVPLPVCLGVSEMSTPLSFC